MADEGNSKTHMAEPVVWLLGVLFVFQLLGGLPGFVQEKLGVDTSFIASFFQLNPSLTDDTPIGTKILNKRSTILRSSPGEDGGVITRVSSGAKGTVIGGPILRDGKLWWHIEYEDGLTGWISEEDIVIDLENDSKALKENTPHGSKVQNKSEATVYSDAGGGIVVGTVAEGARGKILSGPAYIEDKRWWQVKYDDGTVGWVSEDDLEINVKEQVKTVHDGTPFGSQIKNKQDTEVWSGPRYGTLLGTQPKNSNGALVDGAVTVSTNRWWDVDYDTGVDGWVLEDSIERRFAVTEGASKTRDILLNTSYIISLILLIAIVYVYFKFRDENIKERGIFGALSTTLKESKSKNPRWEKILRDVNSDNPNDWRHSIIEADVLLDEIVTKMAYHGATLGDKLKGVEKSDFTTIDKAWEAHKMRNAIAHEGAKYILTQREAKRIIGLYKDVFEEFFFV